MLGKTREAVVTWHEAARGSVSKVSHEAMRCEYRDALRGVRKPDEDSRKTVEESAEEPSTVN